MSLIPPFKVEKLQTALHTKAKNSPDYRFYALYDKLYGRDILEWALVRCRNNRGAPGVDGQSFADIEAYGQDQWLDELTDELRNETYRPRPVRRVLAASRCQPCFLVSRLAASRCQPSFLVGGDRGTACDRGSDRGTAYLITKRSAVRGS